MPTEKSSTHQTNLSFEGPTTAVMLQLLLLLLLLQLLRSRFQGLKQANGHLAFFAFEKPPQKVVKKHLKVQEKGRVNIFSSEDFSRYHYDLGWD